MNQGCKYRFEDIEGKEDARFYPVYNVGEPKFFICTKYQPDGEEDKDGQM